MTKKIKFLDAVKTLQINSADLPKTVTEFEQEVYELLKIPAAHIIAYQKGHSAFGFDTLQVHQILDKIKQQLLEGDVK